jgi:hypothetical protein
MDENAKLFLQYDYAETKDLAKHFLTVVSATLVFSLTFSEKIINFAKASPSTKLLLLVAWSSFIVSIIACGIELIFISLAGGAARYGGTTYQEVAQKAYKAIIVAGSSFVLGLVLLLTTAAFSIYSKPAPVSTSRLEKIGPSSNTRCVSSLGSGLWRIETSSSGVPLYGRSLSDITLAGNRKQEGAPCLSAS